MQASIRDSTRPKQPGPDPQPDEGDPLEQRYPSAPLTSSSVSLGAWETNMGRPNQPGKDKQPSPPPNPKG